MRRPLVLVAALLASACSAPGPPNVLLVTIDTLRADHLGCYGYERPTSPAIDALADDGVRFARAFAQRGATWVSLASILTARYPPGHGVRQQGAKLSPSVTQLPQLLKERGYTTAGIVWRNAYRQQWQGFDSWELAEDPDITEGGIRFLETPRDEPFFLWLHYHRPHSPYAPPEEWARRFATDYDGPLDGSRDATDRITLEGRALTEAELAHLHSLYDGETAWADDMVGQVLAALDRAGLADETLVVLTSDHGEELAQRNAYFYHLASVYDSSLHVPLVMRLPGALPAGRVVDAIVESIDLAPTVLELVGAPVPDGLDGTSLLPLARGESLDLGPAVAEWEDRILTLRTERWRYVWNPTGHHPRWTRRQPAPGLRTDIPIAEEELYDLEEDPDELYDRAAEHPDVARRLRRALLDWAKRHDWKLGGATDAEVDPETRRELEALGYVL